MCLFHNLLHTALFLVLFCNHIDGQERAGCLSLFVFYMSCSCYVAHFHDAYGCSIVCECGIS